MDRWWTDDRAGKGFALVEADGPFFTTPHWNGRQELEEVITDAWLARAPRRLAKEWLAEQGEPG